MRVAKTDTIAGLPAPAARSLVRLFRGGTFAQDVADSLLSRSGIEDADAVFARGRAMRRLVSQGFRDNAERGV
jgi:hypothetical protein